ncbi:hypothetical protein CTI12_AA048200 [Artemisia annua]|uniref:Uncharacterized protein n=1 Tax=Artemisia annua TaxID=35608 RepID=A0A2U1QC43_ARTAN|nr:hypothetical protein CTI12_AA048200 [Artemisia annua]
MQNQRHDPFERVPEEILGDILARIGMFPDLPEVYNSHTHAWTSKATTLAPADSNEGDQRRLIIMKAAGICKTVIFFKDVNGKDTLFFKKRLPRQTHLSSSDEYPNDLDRMFELYCGGWLFVYDIVSHEEGNWLVELQYADLYRRRTNGGEDHDYVSEMPRGMHMEMPTSIRAMSIREIDGYVYVAFQKREVNAHGFNVHSMNYVYAYSIASGRWVDHRVDHPIVANPNASPPMLTNRLLLPLRAPPAVYWIIPWPSK